eukprot:g11481.t1
MTKNPLTLWRTRITSNLQEPRVVARLGSLRGILLDIFGLSNCAKKCNQKSPGDAGLLSTVRQGAVKWRIIGLSSTESSPDHCQLTEDMLL